MGKGGKDALHRARKQFLALSACTPSPALLGLVEVEHKVNCKDQGHMAVCGAFLSSGLHQNPHMSDPQGLGPVTSPVLLVLVLLL